MESGLLGGLWGSYRSLPALAVPWGTVGELLPVGVSTACSGPSCQPGGKAAPLPGQWVRLAGEHHPATLPSAGDSAGILIVQDPGIQPRKNKPIFPFLVFSARFSPLPCFVLS